MSIFGNVYITKTEKISLNINWFLHGFGWLLSSVIGSLITYYFTRKRDKNISEGSKIDNLTSICNLVCLNLALQHSELENLKMNIRDRLQILPKIKGKTRRCSPDERVQALQDFDFSTDVDIDFKNAGKLILAAAKDKRGAAEILQSVFISNKGYFKTINMLELYHEAKRSLQPKSPIDTTTSYLDDLVRFLENNAPAYLEQINKAQSFGKQTLESFKNSMFEMFNIKIYLSLGKSIKL